MSRNIGRNSSRWVLSGNVPFIASSSFAGFYGVIILFPVFFDSLFLRYFFVAYRLTAFVRIDELWATFPRYIRRTRLLRDARRIRCLSPGRDFTYLIIVVIHKPRFPNNSIKSKSFLLNISSILL